MGNYTKAWTTSCNSSGWWRWKNGVGNVFLENTRSPDIFGHNSERYNLRQRRFTSFALVYGNYIIIRALWQGAINTCTRLWHLVIQHECALEENGGNKRRALGRLLKRTFLFTHALSVEQRALHLRGRHSSPSKSV